MKTQIQVVKNNSNSGSFKFNYIQDGVKHFQPKPNMIKNNIEAIPTVDLIAYLNWTTFNNESEVLECRSIIKAFLNK